LVDNRAMENDKPKNKGGRPRKYSRKLADEICRLISSGISLNKIEKMPGMPSYQTVMRWLWRDHPDKDWFRQNYAWSREIQAERMAEEINDIADDSEKDYEIDPDTGLAKFCKESVLRARLRVDARKWTASKLLPKKYGEKLELSGDSQSPLIVNVIRFSDKQSDKDPGGAEMPGSPIAST
jgi:hypothetical protein